MKSRYPRTAFAQQGGLLAAKAQFDKGQLDAGPGHLTWVAENAIEDDVQDGRAAAPGRHACSTRSSTTRR